ncbi:Malto-oligosyltrehalose trehalohydrolase [Thiorhodovibrio winogradskyi]|uniref:Malto-oligosyltrehalose trehalohydrolase n=2 Tax=Thiorhodovibrio winogradskyi TaxID=77007 RepID=A0ABZ0SE09_9GAMM
MPFGCERDPEGRFCFQLWAPAASQVLLRLTSDGREHLIPMERTRDAWYRHCSDLAQPGDLYCYQLNNGLCVPDPASRYQPLDVHGPSQVVDAHAFAWQDVRWRGRPWPEAVFYELHVGSFSPTGDFTGVEARLDDLVDLGITAIELMPLADFPGRWNWGYDGALLFAPDSRYGTPDDLKRLVQAAHQRGLMVFVDVVYNHFGPEGNYLHCYAPGFFHPERQTPWGAAMDFDGPHAAPVREFFICNALFWIFEYGFDGLRLDAVDRIVDGSQPDFLDELATRVRSVVGFDRHVHLVLENDHNDARRHARDGKGRPVFYTAQWNDDAHHALHAALTGESDGVYQDYADAPIERVGRSLAEGFCYQGESSAFRAGRVRGTASAHLPPIAFVNFLQNHDQIGNRGFGERLEHLIPARSFEAALATVLLAPAPPLLFMGQEFAATTPFLFFCDLEPSLMEQVSAGRRREFATQSAFSDPGLLHEIPLPGDPQSFLASRLDWSERERSAGRERLALHAKLLRLRAEHILPLLPGLHHGGRWQRLGEAGLSWCWRTRQGERLHLSVNLGLEPIGREHSGQAAWPVEPDRDRITPIYEQPVRQEIESSSDSWSDRLSEWPPGWVCCWMDAADS